MCGARLPAEEQRGLSSWLKLLVWPGVTGRLAVGAPTFASLMAGMIAFGCWAGALCSATVIPGGEPFRDIAEYLSTAALLAVVIAAGLSVVGGLVVVVPAWLVLRRMVRRGRSAFVAGVRAVFLSPVSFVLPVVVWWACSLVKSTQNPGFGYYTPTTEPAWFHSTFFTVAGSGVWMWVVMTVLLLTAITGAESARTIASELAAGHCRRCGYDLSGLPTLVCPECGDTAPAPPRTTDGVGRSTSAP